MQSRRSKAWPKVWPRLSSARSPCSVSSRATIVAFVSQLTAIAQICSAPAVEDRFGVGLQPFEKAHVADEAVFDDFGIAGAKFARRQRLQDVDVGEHQRRLMEGADQILAMRRIDSGLAADGGVDLRQQGRRNLHEARAAPHACGDEAGEIADDAAAKRDDEIASLDFRRQHLVADAAEDGKRLRGFARLNDDRHVAHASVFQALLQSRQMQPRDILVGHDGAGGARRDARDMRAGLLRADQRR